LKIHEYQAKALARRPRRAVPKGEMAQSVPEALRIAQGLGYPVVVKAQIHAGGRGKGGGVKLARTAADWRVDSPARCWG